MQNPEKIKLYINPDRNKPWNALPLLPPPLELTEDLEIYKDYLIGARTALAELNREARNIANQSILINTLPLREAKDSSEIENIFTTNEELYKAFSKKSEDVDALKGPAKEVIRYREALWEGYHDIKSKGQMDMDYLLKIFQEVKETNQGIRHPSIPTVIRKGGNSLTSGQVVYTPPRGISLIEEKLHNLFEFMNDDQKYNYDPLIKMAIGHYQFEAIHPFSDGNGRTGRIMNIHLLNYKSLLDLPILYLSSYIIAHKEDYYYRIGAVSQRADWKPWIKYILRSVEVTARKTLAKIEDIRALEEAIDKRIYDEAKNIYSKELIAAIFNQPYCTAKQLISMKVGSENTVRRRLRKLEDMGILEQCRDNGHYFYLNIELFNLLSEA